MNIKFEENISTKRSVIYDMAIVLVVTVLHLLLMLFLWFWGVDSKRNLNQLRFKLVELPDYILKEERNKQKIKNKGGGTQGKSGASMDVGSTGTAQPAMVNKPKSVENPKTMARPTVSTSKEIVQKSIQKPTPVKKSTLVQKKPTSVTKTVTKPDLVTPKKIIAPKVEKAKTVAEKSMARPVVVTGSHENSFRAPKDEGKVIESISEAEKIIEPVRQIVSEKPSVKVVEQKIEPKPTPKEQPKPVTKAEKPALKVESKPIDKVIPKMDTKPVPKEVQKNVDKSQVIEPAKTKKVERNIPVASAASVQATESKSGLRGSNINALSSDAPGSGNELNAKSNTSGTGSNLKGNNPEGGIGQGQGTAKGNMGSGSGTGSRPGAGGSGKGLGFQKGGYRLVGRKIYPKDTNKSGSVKIYVTVRADGTVENAGVLKSSGNPVLDKAAVSTARTQYKYTPNKNNGVPVKSKFSYEIYYSLEESTKYKKKSTSGK